MNYPAAKYVRRLSCVVMLRTTVLIFLTAIITSCSTGIESTKKIRMSKEDMRMMTKTEEQTFATEVKGIPLSEWEQGKPFIAMSERAIYIFEPSGLSNGSENENIEGKTLRFERAESKMTPGLNEECILIFSDGSNTFRYDTGKSIDVAFKEIDSSRIPLLSDPAITDKWREKIKGRKLWTRNNLWYDASGTRVSGYRFAEVIVEDILPSTGDFPAKVKIRTKDGETAFIHMNYTSDLSDSRSFPSVFFLSDPKSKYPHISDEHWNLIQRGKVCAGMTKEECRLSLGNPDEINAGHNADETVDFWQYNNGAYLLFTDGLLIRFRL